MQLLDFDPIRDFYQLRYSKYLDKTIPAVELEHVSSERHRLGLYFPASIESFVITTNNVPIGTICYALSPLGDRLYVDNIRIAERYKRSGYGLANLWSLHQAHRLPIVPVQILDSDEAQAFWKKAKRVLVSAGGAVDAEMRRSQVEDERLRWWAGMASYSSITRLLRA